MAYDWRIGLKKVLWIAGEATVAGGIIYFTDVGTGLSLAVIPALEAVRNWIKHR